MDLTPLIQPADTKILLVVMDGLGGYADADHGTELEEAATPHLDQLVREGTAGMVEPVGPGITPGSGPGHLGLFGYDPEQFELGRGALSAAGLDFELRAGDVAARGNLATLDADGAITDRRAGRIPDPEARVVVERLQAEVAVPGVEVFFRHEREHRVLVVLRGAGPRPAPHRHRPAAHRRGAARRGAARPRGEAHRRPHRRGRRAGAAACSPTTPRPTSCCSAGSTPTVSCPASTPASGCAPPRSPSTRCTAGSRACSAWTCSAVRPTSREQLDILRDSWNDYDYFFLHHKYTDSAGEDGDRARKIQAIENLDAVVPQLRALSPDVIAVSGDHSTPSQMAAHSWHPVPTLLWSERCGRDDVEQFGERWCRQGALGLRPTKDLMAFMLANAGRLAKYGA